jgi:hypothetical protein
MLGRIVPIEKGPNEATPIPAIRAGCSSDLAIWFSPNTVGETVAEAL